MERKKKVNYKKNPASGQLHTLRYCKQLEAGRGPGNDANVEQPGR